MTSMHVAGPWVSRWKGAVGALLLLVMISPPVRAVLESSMTAHMLIQYPCLLVSGALLVTALPARWRSGAQRWNELGIAGLVGSTLAMALLMIPRILDLALVDPTVEATKFLVLIATGAALCLSWQRAGVVIQAFFLGNLVWMTAVIGMLYQDSAVRVCNAYRLDDQQDLGSALIWVAIGAGVMWCVHLMRSRTRVDGSDTLGSSGHAARRTHPAPQDR